MQKGWIKKFSFILICGVVLALSYFRAFERFELLTYDLRFKIRPPLKYSPDIAIIEIDNTTLELLGRWPFDRYYHAVLIDALNSLGAKFIAFDILFAEESPSDEQLIAATAIYDNVYYPLVFSLLQENKSGVVASQQIDTPLLDGLENTAQGVGHVNVIADIDGKKRRIPPVIKYKDKLIPHLALLLAQDYLGINRDELEIVPGRFAKIGDIKIPIDEQGNLLINYADVWQKSFKHYSYFDILKAYTQIQNNQPPEIDLTGLKDKICFIGLTATGTTDLSPMPLEPVYPMVGIHANVLNSVIQNKFLIRLGRISNLLILVFLSLISILLLIKRKPLISLGIIASIIVGYILISTILFILTGIWVDLFYSVVLVLLIYVAITLYKFLIEQRKRLLIDKELSIAQNIQRSFLPQDFPKKEGVDISAEMKTAKAVGGDLYDFVDFSETNPNLLGIFIGDVSGKGMPAALYMALSITQFRVSSKGNTSVNKTLSNLNERLLTQSRSGLFITAFYMIYDIQQGRLFYSNGGHLPALIYRVKENKIETVTTKEGGLLGLIPGSEFEQGEVNLSRGDIVVQYTDGVVEARNIKKEDFQEARLKKCLLDYKDLSAQEITKKISEDIINFSGKAPQHDDFTVIALKII